ncbi:MAG: glycosyltransferase family 39 protein [Planctomycetia bacterium]
MQAPALVEGGVAAKPKSAAVFHGWLAAALCLGAWMRLAGLGQPTLWLDEFVTLWQASAPTWGEFWIRSTGYAATPPLFAAVARLMVLGFGPSEWSLRLPAALFDLAALALTACFVRRLANAAGRCGVCAGGIAAILYACDTTLVYHARCARPYGLAMFFAVASTWLAWEAAPAARRRWLLWTAYAASVAGLLATQFLFAPVVAFHFVWLVADQKRRRFLGPWGAAVASAALACSPLAGQFSRLWNDRASLAWATAEPKLERLLEFFHPGAWVGVALVFWLAAMLARRKASPPPTDAAVFLIGWFAVPAALMFAAATLLSPTLLETRYVLYLALPAVGLSAFLLAAIEPSPARWTAVGLFLAATVFPAQFREIATKGHATLVTYDYRPALEKLKDAGRPSDLVLVYPGLVEVRQWSTKKDDARWQSYLAAPVGSFYAGGFTATATAVVPETADREPLRQAVGPTLATAAERKGAVWFLAHAGYGRVQEVAPAVDGMLASAGWKRASVDQSGGVLLMRYERP